MDFNRYISFFTDPDEIWYLKKSADTTNFSHIYQFLPEECQSIEFLQAYGQLQSEKELSYNGSKYISKLFPEGAVILTDQYLKTTLDGKNEQTSIMNEDDFLSKLEEYFQISLQDLLHQG